MGLQALHKTLKAQSVSRAVETYRSESSDKWARVVLENQEPWWSIRARTWEYHWKLGPPPGANISHLEPYWASKLLAVFQGFQDLF